MLTLLFVAALVAFGISAIAGGGASLLLVPLLGRVLHVASIPAALSIGTGASSVSRIAAFRSDIHWGITAWFVPAALPMALLGAFLLRFINPAYMQVLMALFLLSNVPQLLKPQAAPAGSKPSRWGIVFVGAAAGFLSGLTGAVGVVFNRFYLSHGLSKQQIVATRATNDVLVHVAKLIVYTSLGLVDGDALRAGAIVGAAATLSSLLLKPLLARLPHRAFVRVGYAAMIASGVLLLTDSVSRVVREDRIAFNAKPVISGIDATLQWRDASLSIEMNYDDGVEVELGAEVEDLSPAQQRLVEAENPGDATVMIEEVYTLHRRYFEAYYLRGGRVVRRISFDAGASILHDDD